MPEYSTPASLKARLVLVTVPAVEGESEAVRIACRRPDPLVLFANGWLPLEIFATVLEKVQGPMSEFVEAALVDAETYGDFIDRWVCAAAVTPPIVLTEAEAVANEAAIWVEDLAPDVRFAIWRKTTDRLASRRVSEAVTTFRRGQSVDPPAGPDGAAVFRAAVEVVVRG